MSNKIRLDLLLVERGLVESREKGRRMIMAGEVVVNQQLETKPGTQVPAHATIQLKEKPRFVSRGGDKLLGAIEAFGIDPSGWVCADVGASTGGFTDCLLQHGASRVYAIDVGYGQLAWKLRQDERVVVMEKTNARYLDHLPESIDFVVMDASFISIGLLMPVAYNWLQKAGEGITLIKPQFEAGRHEVGKGGVIRDIRIHKKVLHQTSEMMGREGFFVYGLTASPLIGPAGNREFLMWYGLDDTHKLSDLESAIDSAVKTSS